ncbi:T9SS type A sorting domain-containing protein [bacterium]|nr:T9SS type A sorting domain-containing protein [bacterium]
MKRWTAVAISLVLTMMLVVPVWAQPGAQSALDGSLVLTGPEDEPLVFRASLTLAETADLLFTSDNQRIMVEWDTVETPQLGDEAYFWETRYDDANENSLGITVRTTVHLFEGESYLVASYRLFNTRDTDFTLYSSIEMVPTLEGPGLYGGETAAVNPAEGIAYLSEVDRFLGLLFVERNLVSYRAPDYEEFETAEDPDEFRYTQMSAIESSELPFSSDYGLLPIANTGRITIVAGDSTNLVTVWGYGGDASSMTSALLAGRDAWHAVSAPEINPEQPTAIRLAPAWPNPFNASTRFSYLLPENQQMALRVYDLLGRQVATLAEGHRAAGNYQASWDASGLASGTYLVVLEANGTRQAQRVTLVR